MKITVNMILQLILINNNRKGTYHRLFSDLYKIFYVVVLMLLKSCKQHVHDFRLVLPSFLTLRFFLLFKFNLHEQSYKQNWPLEKLFNSSIITLCL